MHEAMGKDVMIASTFHGDSAKFEALLSAGKIRAVQVGDETMYAFRRITVGTEGGSNKVLRLNDGNKSLSNAEYNVASGAFGQLMTLGCYGHYHFHS